MEKVMRGNYRLLQQIALDLTIETPPQYVLRKRIDCRNVWLHAYEELIVVGIGYSINNEFLHDPLFYISVNTILRTARVKRITVNTLKNSYFQPIDATFNCNEKLTKAEKKANRNLNKFLKSLTNDGFRFNRIMNNNQ